MLGSTTTFSADHGSSGFPLPLVQPENGEHWSNDSCLVSPDSQNRKLVSPAPPPSASPARHNVAPAMISPAGAPKAHIASVVPALRGVLASSPATSAPPACPHVSSVSDA